MKKIIMVLMLFILSVAAIAGYNFLGVKKVYIPSANTGMSNVITAEQDQNINASNENMHADEDKTGDIKENIDATIENIYATDNDSVGQPSSDLQYMSAGQNPNNVQNLSAEQESNLAQGQDKSMEQESKRKVDPTKPMVALTFDDGPHPKYTDRILNALEKHDSRATFFVVGSSITRNKNIIKKMSEQGHQIGNHSYDHKELTKLNSVAIKSQVQKTNAEIKNVTNYVPSIMRPTYGSVNSVVRKSVDMPMIMWSIDTMDWKTRNTKKIVNEVMSKVKDGDVVLMHDIYQTTAEAAEILIEQLTKKGYQLVTIDELFEARDIKLQDGKSYRSAYKKK